MREQSVASNEVQAKRYILPPLINVSHLNRVPIIKDSLPSSQEGNILLSIKDLDNSINSLVNNTAAFLTPPSPHTMGNKNTIARKRVFVGSSLF